MMPSTPRRDPRGRPSAGRPGLYKVVTGDYHSLVKSVGVKQLKAKLSEYLRLARKGEVILVTDRDEVIAELRPARRHGATVDGIEETLESLADSGEITRPSLPKKGWAWKVRGLGLPKGTAEALLDEIRADRSLP